ncbi:MAG: hypothetical protein ABSG65_14625 [Bryobacteraceae bacterium]|jgi:hypothetical protein
MNEEEFDSLIRGRPFGPADVKLLETQAGRCTSLGVALWHLPLSSLDHFRWYSTLFGVGGTQGNSPACD